MKTSAETLCRTSGTSLDMFHTPLLPPSSGRQVSKMMVDFYHSTRCKVSEHVLIASATFRKEVSLQIQAFLARNFLRNRTIPQTSLSYVRKQRPPQIIGYPKVYCTKRTLQTQHFAHCLFRASV